MRKFFISLSTLTLLFFSLVGTAPAFAQEAPSIENTEAGFNVRLLDVPATAQDDPRAQSAIVDHLPPGTTIERRFEIFNLSTEEVEIDLSAAAAEIKNNTFTQLGNDTNELSSWISFDETKVKIPAREPKIITAKIVVPQDAAPGESYAAIWAQKNGHKSASAVAVNNRVGLRVYLSVGEGNPPAANFDIVSVTPNKNDQLEPILVVDVKNTGGRTVDITGNLTLTEGPNGLKTDPFSTNAATTLLPGASSTIIITLDKGTPDGPWRANLDLTSGKVTKNYSETLSFPEQPRNAFSGVVKIIMIVLLALFLIMTLVFVALRKKSKAQEPMN